MENLNINLKQHMGQSHNHIFSSANCSELFPPDVRVIFFILIKLIFKIT